MHLSTTGEFINLAKGRGTGVYAAKKRGRWQYRSGQGGPILASGMEPREFVRQFWLRDDFTEAPSEREKK